MKCYRGSTIHPITMAVTLHSRTMQPTTIHTCLQIPHISVRPSIHALRWKSNPNRHHPVSTGLRENTITTLVPDTNRHDLFDGLGISLSITQVTLEQLWQCDRAHGPAITELLL